MNDPEVAKQTQEKIVNPQSKFLAHYYDRSSESLMAYDLLRLYIILIRCRNFALYYLSAMLYAIANGLITSGNLLRKITLK